MKPKCSLPCSQEPTIVFYPEPNEFSQTLILPGPIKYASKVVSSLQV